MGIEPVIGRLPGCRVQGQQGEPGSGVLVLAHHALPVIGAQEADVDRVMAAATDRIGALGQAIVLAMVGQGPFRAASAQRALGRDR